MAVLSPLPPPPATMRHRATLEELYRLYDVNARELHVFLHPYQGDYTQHSTYTDDEEVLCTTIRNLKVSVKELVPTI